MSNVPLSVFSCLEVHERGVTRQTCLAGFCRFFVCFPLGQGYPPSRGTRGLCRAALSGSLRRNVRGRRPSLPCPATSNCSAGTGLPPTPENLAPPYLPHPRLPSLSSLVPDLP